MIAGERESLQILMDDVYLVISNVIEYSLFSPIAKKINCSSKSDEDYEKEATLTKIRETRKKKINFKDRYGFVATSSS